MRKLILGAGKKERMEGATHQDIQKFDGIDYAFDLNLKEWPIDSDSYDQIFANHVVEHLNDLTNFMDNCHRILTFGGTLYLETPCAGLDIDLEWADPQHKRCYVPHSFINYYTREGFEKFGYTSKMWGNLHIEIKNKCLVVHCMPYKEPK